MMTYKFLYLLKLESHFLRFLLIHGQIHRLCVYIARHRHQSIVLPQHLQILALLFPDHFHQHKYDIDLQILQNIFHLQKHHLFLHFQRLMLDQKQIHRRLNHRFQHNFLNQ